MDDALLLFHVQGSEPVPYEVTFKKQGANLSAHCTCAAGQKGMYCKHRFSLMNGDTKNLKSQNHSDASLVVEWVKGSDVEAALLVLAEAEQDLEKAKAKLSRCKKQLAKAMQD